MFRFVFPEKFNSVLIFFAYIHIPFVQNLRVKYYKEEDWICEKKLVEGLA